jgi:competence protein ComEC
VLKRPLFLVASAFAAGIILAGAFKLPPAIVLSILGFGCILAVSRQAYTIALIIVVVAAGMVRYNVYTILSPDYISRFINAHPTAVIGRVTSEVDLREDRAMIPLEVHAIEVAGRIVPANGTLMLVCYRPYGEPNWNPPDYGAYILVRSSISSPAGANNPGSFSWKDYLARKKIFAVSYAGRPEQITLLPEHEANPFVTLALRTKEWFSDAAAAKMPKDEASTVSGMVLGNYAALPDRLLSNFRKTGTLHLLAASGFNCAIIVIVFGFLLSKVLRLPRRYSDCLLILLLVFYMLMVGAKPSIVRATVMATLWIAGRILNRPSDTINLLFGAALIILALNPADLFDVSFQLSFAAVLALLLVLPVIAATAKQWGIDPGSRKTPPKWTFRVSHSIVKDGWQGLIATTAATLGTLPISAYYFNQLSLVSIAVNAIVAVAILPIFAIGLILPVTAPIPVLGDITAFAGTGITRMTLSTINWFGDMSFSCISVPSPGIIGILGYYILLAAFLRYANARILTKERTDNS